MNKENLEQGLTKLLKTFFTKKYDRDFSDLTVVLDEHEEDADDVDDEGNWVSAESYYFTVYSNNFNGSQPLIELYNFENKLPVWEVAGRISNGVHRLAPVVVTIPEGFDINQIVNICSLKLPNFNKIQFLSQVKNLEEHLGTGVAKDYAE